MSGSAQVDPMGSGAADWRGADLTAVLLLIAIVLIGFAEIAALPPFEGFDEIAHWSAVQQVADTGRPPRWGEALSQDHLAYPGPLPVGVERRGRTYQALRTQSPAGSVGPGRFAFEPQGMNWQAQHPPLYYMLMAPIYRLSHGLAWRDHFLVLRSVSWLMASLGLALGALGIRGAARVPGSSLTPWTTPLALLWPLVFAGYIADLARMGNDSLCILLFGAVWRLLLPLLARASAADAPRPEPLTALAIGVLLGMGLWTKAFFGPISLGVGALLLARVWRGKRSGLAIDAGAAVGLAWAIGAAWYLMKLRTTGALTGSSEAVDLVRAGGLLHGLAKQGHPVEFIKGLAGIAVTVGWVGTWSLLRLSEPAMIPVVGLLMALGWGYLARLRTTRDLAAFAPLAMIAPMAAGLIYHVLIRMALDGSGSGTPGWYLHVIAPALGLMMALGWTRPRLMGLLALYSVGYTAVSWWAELRFFSGCVAPDALKHYDFAHAACGMDWGVLSRLTHPGLAGAALASGLLALAAAAWLSRAAWRRPATDTAVLQLQPL